MLLHLAMRSLLALPKDSGVESPLWTSLEACMVAPKQVLWPQQPQQRQQQQPQQLEADGGSPLTGMQKQEEQREGQEEQEEQEQGAVQQRAELAGQPPEEGPVYSSSHGLDSQPVSSSSMPSSAAPGAASDAVPATADYEVTSSTQAVAAIEPMPTRPPPARTGLMLVLTALLYGSATAAAGVWLALLRCKRQLARLQRQARGAEGAEEAAGAAPQLQLDAAAGGLLPASSPASPRVRQTPAADGVAVVAVTGGATAGKEGEYQVAAARRSLCFPSLQRPSAYGAKHKVSPQTAVIMLAGRLASWLAS